MIPKRMLRVVLVAAFLCTTVHATEWLALPLHRRIELSDTIVVARVVDPAKALVSVERVFKGEPPEQIRLVSYIDGLKAAGPRTPLRRDARELLFLVKADDGYAPLQTEYGRLAIEGDRLIDAFWSEPRRLSGTIASVERLVRLQARAASGDRAADRAYVEALRSRDPDVRSWPLETAPDRIETPSRALTEAFLARWPGDARGVARAAAAWRLREAAPTFAEDAGDFTRCRPASVCRPGVGQHRRTRVLAAASPRRGDGC